MREASGRAGHPWIAVLTLGLLLVVGLLSGCDYARMKEDESLHTFETKIPNMPKKTIPVKGGIEVLREANPLDLTNPLPPSQEIADRGKERYAFYCIQCHGPKLDGFGTVGQSFHPLPSNLTSPAVLEQKDGELFSKINLGFKQHPPLWDTVAADESWAIIQYMRFLAKQPLG